MICSDIDTYARAKYNGTGDTFFSTNEILYYIYQAELELAVECEIIEALNTAIPSVAGTQGYAYPTNVIALKRVTYNGQKLQKITFREDDSLTLNNATSALSGTPAFYYEWNGTIYLRPVPDTSSLNIIIYSFNQPTVPTSGSTPEIPSIFHMDLVDYVVMQMYYKDKDPLSAGLYEKKWANVVSKVKRWAHKKKRTDAFTVVQDEDSLATTIQGPV